MKNTIKWLVIITVLCTVGFLLNLTLQKNGSNKAIKEKRAVLPIISLLRLDSAQFVFSSVENKPLLLIHFNSECDHCQYEASDIKKNIGRFSQVNIVFMSSEALSHIRVFAEQSGLVEYENIHFTKINAQHATAAFGALAVPHVFIYGPDKTLMKEFRGETSATVILKHLPAL